MPCALSEDALRNWDVRTSANAEYPELRVACKALA